ncbi:MAG: STAS domain-containing protein [Vicinamibacterales bacterium]
MKDVEVIRLADDVAVVSLHGDHDCATREQLAVLLSEEVAANALVVVDVTDADFVDSSFLLNLEIADGMASARGSRFVLQMGTAHIVRIVKISGLRGTLDCAESREEALARHPGAAYSPAGLAA